MPKKATQKAKPTKKVLTEEELLERKEKRRAQLAKAREAKALKKKAALAAVLEEVEEEVLVEPSPNAVEDKVSNKRRGVPNQCLPTYY